MARIRERKTRDINQIKCIKDGTDRLLVKDEEIMDKWREYFDKLFNGESESPTLELGLEKKLEAREPARARGGSARLEPAREPHASRAEPISLARKNSEPSRASAVRLASRLASSAQHGSSRPRRQILPYSLPPPIGTESWSQGRRRYASCHV